MSDAPKKRQPETDAERAQRLRAQEMDAPTISEAEFKAKSRRSFIVGGAAALAGVLGWKWIDMQPKVDRIPALLRSNHELAESVWRGLYRPGAMAPTFPISASGMPKANGRHGLGSEIDLDAWSMQILNHAGQEIGRMDMDAIRALPKVEMTTELKCIEGWSQIVHWGGARFSDVAAMVPEASQREYVGLATPDGDYTVGMDMASMMHAQTLLAYEMQGEPLALMHGAPLRLMTPLKYGVKQIKRIGSVQFTDTRPDDYWAERGYDWYIGH